MCWHSSRKANNRDSTVSCQRKSRRNAQNVSWSITNIVPKLKLDISTESLKNWKSLIEMELIFTISISLSVAFAAEALWAEKQFRRLRSKLKNLKSLKFLFGMRRPTVFKRIWQHFEPLKIIVVISLFRVHANKK